MGGRKGYNSTDEDARSNAPKNLQPRLIRYRFLTMHNSLCTTAILLVFFSPSFATFQCYGDADYSNEVLSCNSSASSLVYTCYVSKIGGTINKRIFFCVAQIDDTVHDIMVNAAKYLTSTITRVVLWLTTFSTFAGAVEYSVASIFLHYRRQHRPYSAAMLTTLSAILTVEILSTTNRTKTNASLRCLAPRR